MYMYFMRIQVGIFYMIISYIKTISLTQLHINCHNVSVLIAQVSLPNLKTHLTHSNLIPSIYSRYPKLPLWALSSKVINSSYKLFQT